MFSMVHTIHITNIPNITNIPSRYLFHRPFLFSDSSAPFAAAALAAPWRALLNGGPGRRRPRRRRRSGPATGGNPWETWEKPCENHGKPWETGAIHGTIEEKQLLKLAKWKKPARKNGGTQAKTCGSKKSWAEDDNENGGTNMWLGG